MKELYKVEYKVKDDLKTLYMYAKDEQDAQEGYKTFIDGTEDTSLVDICEVWQGSNDDYVCGDCGGYFSTPFYYRETHGFTDGSAETFCKCPHCHSDNIMDKREYENYIYLGDISFF